MQASTGASSATPSSCPTRAQGVSRRRLCKSGDPAPLCVRLLTSNWCAAAAQQHRSSDGSPLGGQGSGSSKPSASFAALKSSPALPSTAEQPLAPRNRPRLSRLSLLYPARPPPTKALPHHAPFPPPLLPSPTTPIQLRLRLRPSTLLSSPSPATTATPSSASPSSAATLQLTYSTCFSTRQTPSSLSPSFPATAFAPSLTPLAEGSTASLPTPRFVAPVLWRGARS